MSTTPISITSEIQKLAPSAIIELFEVDATDLGGDIVRFHAGTNELHANVTWQGNVYNRYPVQIDGFEVNGQGSFPRPTMKVSNVLSAITILLMTFGDLLGAKVTRKRTFVKYIDAVNFAAGNPSADPTAHFDDDVYFIDRKATETRDEVSFELAAAVDLIGVQIPRRQIVQNVCIWKYRGPECGYTGGPLYDVNDQPLTSAPTAAGQSALNTWKLLGTANDLVSSTLTALSIASQNKDAATAPQLLEERYEVIQNFTDSQYFQPSLNYCVLHGNDGPANQGQTQYYWNGALVSPGTTYAAGAVIEDVYVYDAYGSTAKWQSCKIQRYGLDAGVSAAATAAYNSALTTYNNAVTAAATALTNYNAAEAALPANDPIFALEKCGKRLTSCKLRFGANNELPFGSFPSVGLIK